MNPSIPSGPVDFETLLQRLGEARQAGPAALEEAARALLEAALAAGDRVRERIACNSLGIVHLLRREFDVALQHFRAAAVLARQAGDVFNETGALGNIALVHQSRSHWALAQEQLLAALQRIEESGQDLRRDGLLHNLASVHFAQRRYLEAATAWREAADAAAAAGEPSNEAPGRLNELLALLRLGQLEKASMLLETLPALLSAHGSPGMLQTLAVAKAILCMKEGDAESALELLAEPLAELAGNKLAPERILAFSTAAECHEMLDQMVEAEEAWQQALDTAGKLEQYEEALDCCRRLGTLCRKGERWEEALDWADEALVIGGQLYTNERARVREESQVRYEAEIHQLKSVRLAQANAELQQAIAEGEARRQELERTLKEMRVLQDLLPICMSCNNVRDDAGYWSRLDDYISAHTATRFSHGICPDCARREFGEYYGEDKAEAGPPG
jgi:tetratricopeptide (TPR) repeat protein